VPKKLKGPAALMTDDNQKSMPLPLDDPAFLLEDSPFYNINRTSSAYVSEMAKILKAVDMDQSRWRILMLLAEKNPLTVSEISHNSFIKLSTITHMLIRMEGEGLVERRLSPADNRVTDVYATEKGLAIVNKLRRVVSRVYDRAFDGLSNEDALNLIRILKAIHTNLTRSPYHD
jgi:DNA-binding MarR family transcriptional regulator